MVNCLKCKWFSGLVMEDECGTHYGYCRAMPDEIMLSEDEAKDNYPCDLYVNNNISDNTTEKP